MTVPLELKGTPKGEADGGVLQQIISRAGNRVPGHRHPRRRSGTTSRRWRWTTCCTSRTCKLPAGRAGAAGRDLIVATVKEIVEEAAPPSRRSRRRRARSHRPQARGRRRSRRRRGGGEEVDGGVASSQLPVARTQLILLHWQLALDDCIYEAHRRPRKSRSRVCRHPAQHRVRGGRSASRARLGWIVEPASSTGMARDEVRRPGARRNGRPAVAAGGEGAAAQADDVHEPQRPSGAGGDGVLSARRRPT